MMSQRGVQLLAVHGLRGSLQKASLSTTCTNNKSYKVVVLGGGTAGCATAVTFAKKLGKGKVAIIDKSDMHYYQPMWTLIGGGMKPLEQSMKPMGQILPTKADWIHQPVAGFDPHNNKVITGDGREISYEYLVVALGLQVNYDEIKGLLEALETPGVCSNYSHLYVNKTFESMKNFKEGNALFTVPNTPIKCAGAPQKIMYITEEYLRKHGKRDKANIEFYSSLSVLFGIKKYADALWKVVHERDIKVKLRQNLIEVKPDSREAVFQNLDNLEELTTVKYEMLHVTPPMATTDALRNCSALADEAGFLRVSKETLQHDDFPNIFGIGDCINVPVSKTAAAVASQVGVIIDNLSSALDGKDLKTVYDGYSSCPLVTGYSTCILAEFDMDGNPMETFPFNQAKERRTMFHLKKDMMPILYWKGLLNGYWIGPKVLRTAMHLGFK